ncbi:MAG: dihydropteroate synthase [Desulfobulbaceae bacterium]|nr:dihydropteroate synthase [Desulfobulbaceae bacterium]
MGILNVTPDSFSDGGRFRTETEILDQTETMIAAGADIIDVGGESTRPFSDPVTIEEELARVIPAITAIRRRHRTLVSIDTTKSEVARQALSAGANIINDISALRYDPEMVHLARESKAPIILMHMQGTPGNMQVNPDYHDVIEEIIVFFRERIAWAEQNGVSPDKIIVDPGIGFGKTVNHNLTILKHLASLKKLGRPVMLGHSRKSFMEKILGLKAEERDLATAAVSALSVLQDVSILRVHDVDATAQAVRLALAIRNAP